MKINILVPFLLFIPIINCTFLAQKKQFVQDSIFIKNVYNTALSEGKSHADLKELCKNIGARLSGSPQAQMAIEWSEQKMKSYGFDNVLLQEIMVPHWERGTKEVAWMKTNSGQLIPMDILALGGSIGTNGLLKSEIIGFKNIFELSKAKKSDIEGKIVFLYDSFNQSEIQTFKAYGACYPNRGDGAVEASKLGALAIVIRSLASSEDDHPHTGSMHYNDSVAKIPAAALSTNASILLQKELFYGKVEFIIEMNCQDFPDIPSYNVMCELTGSSKSDEIITFGGHLDSWDTGEGAHDDGAGVIHCLEALRVLKIIGFKPKHTIRLVFFMNEENGNRGGKTYATWVKEKGEKQVAALESDRGGFTPQGFDCDGDEKYLKMIQAFETLLKPYQLFHFEKGFGGVDISPLKKEFVGIPLFGFVPDSQRYFDFHHAETDVFENVNKRELELGCAAIASFLYLLDAKL